VKDQIYADPNNVALWSLPGSTKWFGKVERLYNRPCYDEITKNITTGNLSDVLIIGTPGIGKTLYLQAFLVHLVRSARLEGRDVPVIHYKYIVDATVVTLSLLPDGSAVDISGDKSVPDPDYTLSDSVDIEIPLANTLTLLVASDKDTNYNLFSKRVDEAGYSAGRLFLMPLFSFDELRSIRPDMEAKHAQFRYEVYGGSARRFVGGKNWPHVLPIIYDALTEFFPDIKRDCPDAWERVVTEMSAQFGVKTTAGQFGTSSVGAVSIGAVINSMMVHRSNGNTVWASRFMEWLAAAMYNERTPGIYDELNRIFGPGGFGNSFEATGHRKLIKSTVPFLLKRLIPSRSRLRRRLRPKFENATFNLPLVRFKEVAEVENLPDGSYGLPMDINLGGCDAVIQPDTLLEFTTTPKKHVASLKKIADIRAQLRAHPSEHRIIFVIPLANAKTFEYHEDLADIQQFICVDESSVIGEVQLMTNAEKKAEKRRIAAENIAAAAKTSGEGGEGGYH